MSYADEFSTVDMILTSAAKTRAVDAFALSLIKAERQARRLLTYLVFQFPVFTATDGRSLRKTLAANRCVYFDGVLAGLDAISPVSVRDLVGQEYDRLRERLRGFGKHRNKIFHGQLTADGLTRAQLLESVADIKLWCRTLGANAERELGYDGFMRNSFRKAPRPGFSQRLRVQIKSLEEYAAFIRDHMERSSPTAQRTGGSRCSIPGR